MSDELEKLRAENAALQKHVARLRGALSELSADSTTSALGIYGRIALATNALDRLDAFLAEMGGE